MKDKNIGTPSRKQKDGSHEYIKAFEGKTETSFDHDTPSNGWIGMDLGSPQRITSIVYSP